MKIHFFRHRALLTLILLSTVILLTLPVRAQDKPAADATPEATAANQWVKYAFGTSSAVISYPADWKGASNGSDWVISLGDFSVSAWDSISLLNMGVDNTRDATSIIKEIVPGLIQRDQLGHEFDATKVQTFKLGQRTAAQYDFIDNQGYRNMAVVVPFTNGTSGVTWVMGPRNIFDDSKIRTALQIAATFDDTEAINLAQTRLGSVYHFGTSGASFHYPTGWTAEADPNTASQAMVTGPNQLSLMVDDAIYLKTSSFNPTQAPEKIMKQALTNMQNSPNNILDIKPDQIETVTLGGRPAARYRALSSDGNENVLYVIRFTNGTAGVAWMRIPRNLFPQLDMKRVEDLVTSLDDVSGVDLTQIALGRSFQFQTSSAAFSYPDGWTADTYEQNAAIVTLNGPGSVEMLFGDSYYMQELGVDLSKDAATVTKQVLSALLRKNGIQFKPENILKVDIGSRAAARYDLADRGYQYVYIALPFSNGTYGAVWMDVPRNLFKLADIDQVMQIIGTFDDKANVDVSKTLLPRVYNFQTSGALFRYPDGWATNPWQKDAAFVQVVNPDTQMTLALADVQFTKGLGVDVTADPVANANHYLASTLNKLGIKYQESDLKTLKISGRTAVRYDFTDQGYQYAYFVIAFSNGTQGIAVVYAPEKTYADFGDSQVLQLLGTFDDASGVKLNELRTERTYRFETSSAVVRYPAGWGINIDSETNVLKLSAPDAELSFLDAAVLSRLKKVDVSGTPEDVLAAFMKLDSQLTFDAAQVKSQDINGRKAAIYETDSSGSHFQEIAIAFSDGSVGVVEVMASQEAFKRLDQSLILTVVGTFDATQGNQPAAGGAKSTEAPASAGTGECTVTASSEVNVRSGPGTDSEVIDTLSAGDKYPAVGQKKGADGLVWWKLDDQAWVRSDLVKTEGNCSAVPQADS